VSVTHPLRGPTYAWPDGEAYTDHPRGTLKSGKEAEIFLVERSFARSGPRLLAHKRYRIRNPGKDELRDEGFSNATSFRRHAMYREGWNVNARDRRALAAGNKSRHGQELASVLWPIQEWAVLRRAWEAGVSVPYPSSRPMTGCSWSSSATSRRRHRSWPRLALRPMSWHRPGGRSPAA
jgi:hypothetical protein